MCLWMLKRGECLFWLFQWPVLQNESITKQLDAGIRYFDLRIARKPNDTDPTRLYFYHGLYTQTDVEVKMEDATMKNIASSPYVYVVLYIKQFSGVYQYYGRLVRSVIRNFYFIGNQYFLFTFSHCCANKFLNNEWNSTGFHVAVLPPIKPAQRLFYIK